MPLEIILGALCLPTHFSFASDRDIKIRMGQISAFGLSTAPASDRAIVLSTEANPEATVEGGVTCGGQKNAEAVGPIPWAALSGDVIGDGVLVRRQRACERTPEAFRVTAARAVFAVGG